MVAAQVWTLIGLLATVLFSLLVQLRSLDQRVANRFAALTVEVRQTNAELNRGFGELRGDIAVLRARIDRDWQLTATVP
jgi:hypothetical protein